ncbi:MAG: NifU family protein [Lutibacter sp.]|nr:NifU family protein [Lutibacter sp.]MBP9601388.1 NifU family protein [Lutibacter sp.]
MSTITLHIEKTTNEAIIKFSANVILSKDTHQFGNIDEAKNSPLAQQLFHLPFVKRVLISVNFIAVERYSIVEWADVQEELRTQLEDYLNNDGVILIEDNTSKKVPVEVYAEETPNPNVQKFVANKKLVINDLEYKNASEAKKSPLAIELFHFPFVNEVFISENYVSITKNEFIEWGEITVELRSFIKEYIAAGKTITNEIGEKQVKTSDTTQNFADLDDVSLQIIAILDEHIRPAVASDGGNILFQSYDVDTKVVSVLLQGACSGCPSSTITLKNGIESMLKQLIPGKIEEVVAINY